jgi:hypothetical protein
MNKVPYSGSVEYSASFKGAAMAIGYFDFFNAIKEDPEIPCVRQREKRHLLLTAGSVPDTKSD